MRRCLELFASLLEYPAPGVVAAAAELAQRLAAVHPPAAGAARAFQQAVQRIPPGRLEERYTATFELDASCHPYAGYHLFGDSYKRSLFLLRLKAIYAACGFAPSGELPDHIAVMLRFLGRCAPGPARAELIQEALLPALARMLGGPQVPAQDGEPAGGGPSSGVAGPYRWLLQALQEALRAEVAGEAVASRRGLEG